MHFPQTLSDLINIHKKGELMDFAVTTIEMWPWLEADGVERRRVSVRMERGFQNGLDTKPVFHLCFGF